jgi:hypothetical protein
LYAEETRKIASKNRIHYGCIPYEVANHVFGDVQGPEQIRNLLHGIVQGAQFIVLHLQYLPESVPVRQLAVTSLA